MNFKDNRVSISLTISIDNLRLIQELHKTKRSLSETVNMILKAARDNEAFMQELKEVCDD